MVEYNLTFKELEEGKYYKGITDNSLEVSPVKIKNGLPCNIRTERYIKLTIEEVGNMRFSLMKNTLLLKEREVNALRVINPDYVYIRKNTDGTLKIYGPDFTKDITDLFDDNLPSIPANNINYNIDELIDFFEEA